jgi:hypothetical protein
MVVGGNVTIRAEVTGGTADRVEFLVDGHILERVTADTYVVVWNKYRPHDVGWHTLTARAIAANRVEVLSKPVSIYIAR